MENKDLVAITMVYTQDGLTFQKVVGIFEPKDVVENINLIKNHTFCDEKIKRDEGYNEDGMTFFEYDDDNKTYFYTSIYTVGELRV